MPDIQSHLEIVASILESRRHVEGLRWEIQELMLGSREAISQSLSLIAEADDLLARR
jgi:hypothetical protein